MRKTLSFIILISVLTSCTPSKQKDKEAEVSTIQPAEDSVATQTEVIYLDPIVNQDSIDNTLQDYTSIIDYVKSNVSIRTDTLDFREAFPFNKNYHRLPNEFRDQLDGLPLQNAYRQTLSIDEYNRYNIIDYFEDNRYFYFRILIDDENCCRSLYLITMEPENEQIFNISFLGLKGGDGGWGEFDTEYWTSDSTLLYVKLSTYDQDIEQDSYLRSTDSMIVAYSIINGKVHRELLDSIHYEHKITSN
ncbi:hypothetical protein [Marinoscillum pacificum]|uniref:hypothetical protein n=1 Tax=Marinoscillum pacificum TaxID=392723 RepID=UPI0021576A8E|nr:hypothetical protein [Marinoscillum pacificum]